MNRLSRDFTLDKYRELCQTLLEYNYSIEPVFDYLQRCDVGQESHNKVAIIRHDVDRKLGNSLRMAELEHAMGIRSTYYFRYPYTFKPEIVRQIQGLGHEIGYHYEVLSKTKGDFQKAIALFASELDEFRKICPVDTICMHGNPLSPVDNRDLWKRHDFHQFGIKGEAYLSIRNVDYFSDTGRNWNGENNLRDFLTSNSSQECLETTDDLIQFIRETGSRVIYLTIHPERWAHSPGSFLLNYGTDSIFNFGKKIIRGVRR